ncbi:hydrogenase maturation protease [Desulfotalea psychrophila]|uniref:Related to coenzyme F420 hydrogenase, delta subunit n=1 Tax=Desulfotalea psychrophila (strain LSv54 / DSM 12343) TaxID=177439 RepID=Q6API7_DESPS|nr:hydrogenase maturation protease [Desulfotalea psychrophila]CAG35737.1 related to coenzyme F420 hydrogenase, delta subunit [Desulfotalea psychrophila LSv54]
MSLKKCSTMIFGCGNITMGDDGFGPAVIDELHAHYELPEGVQAIDADTGIREYLFDYLLSEEDRPDRIIVLDAVDFPDRNPGEVFYIAPDSIPSQKIHDFSLHQFPTVNMLLELEQYTGMEIKILAAQIECIPKEIAPGLSEPMSKAVPAACEMISQILLEKS